jgi:CHASE2 domain-containing sensor protein
MGQGKVIVLGMDGANEHQARDQASALAHALALPRLKALGSSAQIIIWAVSALLGLSLLFVSGAKALRRAVLYLLLALVACFLAFQMKSVWFPPAIPALLLLCCGVYCRLFNPSPKAS